MAKNSDIKKIIDIKITKLRLNFLKLIYLGAKYHIGGSLSALDIIVSIFYGNYVELKRNRKNIFLLSKGHALGIYHSILIDKKIITEKKLINKMKKGLIGGQLDIYNTPFCDWNSGSLGHSIGVAIGLSYANKNKKIYTLVGDAEIDEGSIWEALLFISEKNIKNIHIIIDRNKLSASSFIDKKNIFDDKILDKLKMKTFYFNGHNTDKIVSYLDFTKYNQISTIAVISTIKGNGFKEFENNIKYSHGIPPKNILKQILERNNIKL